MKRPIAMPLLAAACATAALAGPAAAGAAPKLPTGKDTWAVSVKGTQKTTWSVHHVPDGTLSCDADQTGSGTETISFSSKPRRLTAFTGGDLPSLMGGKGGASLDLRGTVKREGSIQTGVPLDLESCPDGVGGGEPAADCGAKPFTHLFAMPEWDPKGRRIRLSQDTAVPLTPSFKHCPASGVTWPSMLTDNGKGKDIATAFPFKELEEHGKHIVIAKGKASNADADTTWSTSIRWELTFKRLKHEGFGR